MRLLGVTPRLEVMFSALFAGISVLSFSAPAPACGASAGSGGVAVCTLQEIREKERKKFHLGALYALSSTDIHFSGGPLEQRERFSQERHVALGTFEWRPTRRWNLQLGAGSLFGGYIGHPTLLGATQRSAFSPGVVAMLGTSFVIRRADGPRPFVLLTGQLSGVFAQTEGTESQTEARYSAYDLRLGGAVGWTLWRSLSPYLLARTFGGPVYFSLGGEDVTGTDRYHYQFGGGLSLLLGGRVDLFVEGVGLGERGLTAGAGLAF